jgi:hypothetical protein
MTRPSFGHLAAAGVAGTEKKYLEFSVHQQHPAGDFPFPSQPQTGSPPVKMALKSAWAQPTPDFTEIASNAQLRWHAPHSMHRLRSMISARWLCRAKTRRGQTSMHLPHPVHASLLSFRVTTFFRYFIRHPIPVI